MVLATLKPNVTTIKIRDKKKSDYKVAPQKKLRVRFVHYVKKTIITEAEDNQQNWKSMKLTMTSKVLKENINLVEIKFLFQVEFLTNFISVSKPWEAITINSPYLCNTYL